MSCYGIAHNPNADECQKCVRSSACISIMKRNGQDLELRLNELFAEARTWQ
jgi:hypothetical protein